MRSTLYLSFLSFYSFSISFFSSSSFFIFSFSSSSFSSGISLEKTLIPNHIRLNLPFIWEPCFLRFKDNFKGIKRKDSKISTKISIMMPIIVYIKSNPLVGYLFIKNLFFGFFFCFFTLFFTFVFFSHSKFSCFGHNINYSGACFPYSPG